ncbi:MAG: hypothetical protein GF334_11495 [Candidatus Altiarchaeales archaeon]|nr:hypothetical protein [Candidatus Altiarchaeales archaeon]
MRRRKTTIGCILTFLFLSLLTFAQTPGVGDVVITEIMPSPTTEPGGEYIEIYNPSNETYVLDGLILEDNAHTHAILASQPITPGQYLLLCKDRSVIGPCSYEYDSVQLNNGGDFVRLLNNGTVIDEVQYTSNWPYDEGVSLNLDLSAFNCLLNDDSANWCASTQTFGGVDFGTPGMENNVCSTPSSTTSTTTSIYSTTTSTSSTTTSTTSESSTTTVTSATTTSLADVVINEFLSDVGDTDWDDDGEVDASDDEWIELYNNEDYEVDLAGWILADEAENRYILPADTLIYSKDYLLLYGSETGIPLNNVGDTIYLMGPLNDTVDSVDYSDNAPDKDASFGRYPDGGDDWALFSDPTPEDDNPGDAPDGWCDKDGDCPDEDEEYFCQDGDVWLREFEGDCDTETHECGTKESEERHSSCTPPRVCVVGVDECLMPTTTTVEAACRSNADCGGTQRGDRFCEGNKVYQNVLWGECINPGGVNAVCEEKKQKALVQSCSDQEECLKGVCRITTTTTLNRLTTSSTTVKATTIPTTTLVYKVDSPDGEVTPTGASVGPYLVGAGVIISELFVVVILFSGLFLVIHTQKNSSKDDDL